MVSHSQIVITLHPADLSAAALRASRSTFAENFFSQNSRLVLGVEEAWQLGWRCQKQPWTKIANRCFGKTISGVPGRSRRWILYRKPSEWSDLLTASSGSVFACLTDRIILLRIGSALIYIVRKQGIGTSLVIEDVRSHGLGDCGCEINGNRVSDEAPDLLELHALSGFNEFVFGGKAL